MAFERTDSDISDLAMAGPLVAASGKNIRKELAPSRDLPANACPLPGSTCKGIANLMALICNNPQGCLSQAVISSA